jgi:hypothetical protein
MDRASQDTISSRNQLIHHKLMLFQHRTLKLVNGDELVSRVGIGVGGLVSERGSEIGRVMVRGGTQRGVSQGLRLVGMSRGEWEGGMS